jgi:hypothetical protein
MRNSYKILLGHLRKREFGRPIEEERSGVDSSGYVQGAVTGCCERDNEPSDTIKCWEFFFEWLRNY